MESRDSRALRGGFGAGEKRADGRQQNMRAIRLKQSAALSVY
jgi:hypothetical protein